MEKIQIPFNKSMTADKRNPDFCYLRNNVYPSRSRGMYPSVDFETISGAPAGYTTAKHVGNAVFFTLGDNTKRYNYSGGSSLGTEVGVPLIASPFVDAVDGNDGIHYVTENGTVSNSTSTVSTAADATAIIFDGLYYYTFANQKIFRHLKTAAPTEVFGDTGADVVLPFAHGNDIFFMTEDGLDFTIHVWGKDSATLVDRKVKVHNARLLACGSLDGVAIFVTGVGNAQNSKEKEGEIVISAFDGEKLVELNSIKAGSGQILRKSQSIGNSIMIFGVSANQDSHNADLYNNYVYKIQADGAIETMFDETLSNASDIAGLSVQYDYVTVILDDNNFYRNVDGQNSYDGYLTPSFTDPTVYITNLLDFTGSKYKLGGIGFTFEKMFENATNSEALTVSYRVSERDSWTLIDTITADKIKDNTETRMSQTVKDAERADDSIGMTPQMYEITKMPDGTAFNEYYEIQFKFESIKGFSIIDAWRYRDIIKRNTRA